MQLNQQNISELLSKIESYENKNELYRFLLILSFGGLLSILAGFLELVFYEFFDTDVLFFQYNFSNSSKPVFLYAVWIITIIPVLIILIFTTGTSGFINWNKTYRFIGLVAIICYFSADAVILILGKSKTDLIPLIWGIFLFLGFLSAAFLIYNLEKQSKVAIILILFGIIILTISMIVFLFVEDKLAMFYMLTSFGVLMTVSAGLMYLLETRFAVLESMSNQVEE